jgi:hypothetical protein
MSLSLRCGARAAAVTVRRPGRGGTGWQGGPGTGTQPEAGSSVESVPGRQRPPPRQAPSQAQSPLRFNLKLTPAAEAWQRRWLPPGQCPRAAQAGRPRAGQRPLPGPPAAILSLRLRACCQRDWQ